MTATPVLPSPHEAALLLDMDGTLLDIAPTPESVVVEPGLPEALLAIRGALGGALAIVTGRPVEQVDALFPNVPYAVAGEHGGAIRYRPGADLARTKLPDPPAEWALEAARIVDAHPGTRLERKQRGFVLHFRAKPTAGDALHHALRRLIAPLGDGFQIMPALMAWEVKPRGADKGTAVSALATEAPFAGRRPIFIGDDVTDEDGMKVAREMRGAGFRVGEWFGTAAGVRAWLKSSADALSAGRDWPAPPLSGTG